MATAAELVNGARAALATMLGALDAASVLALRGVALKLLEPSPVPGTVDLCAELRAARGVLEDLVDG